MDLRQLRYFVAVAERGSISVAAQAVHIAQPALTRQIQALEEELGTALFERTTRGASLTDAGKQLLTDANRLLDDAAAAKERTQRAGRGEIGHLSIGLPAIQFASPMIAKVLRSYRQEVPGASVTLRHHVSDAQLSLLSSGQLDAGFLLFKPLDDPAFEGVSAYSEKILLAYPVGWQWQRGKPKVLRDLNNEEFIWLPRNAAPTFHDKLIHYFFNAGFIPKTSVHGVDAASMLTLVEAGMGCTVLPESARRHASETVAFMEISDLDIKLNWELVWRAANRSSVLRRFIDIVTSHMTAQDHCSV
ncbi:LysR family transcriptional regulator [Bradyrhizobium manausense]|uniref:LysR family transcriptional regulator n=1 Tax=Bradyrhizobium manausense TaxID=989370 RepID=UPI001BA59FE1|nr:LysR family transcriptional regulator [Bradyrhizobium manausense]MBR0828557.1 LysR family transcriptional regulator [Bradyrhizobium manausense]